MGLDCDKLRICMSPEGEQYVQGNQNQWIMTDGTKAGTRHMEHVECACQPSLFGLREPLAVPSHTFGLPYAFGDPV